MKFGQTNHILMVNLLKEKNKDMGHSLGKLKVVWIKKKHMMVSFLIIYSMEMAHIIGIQEGYIQGNGKKVG